MLEHPTCSPDLAFSDYYLFLNIKIFLIGKLLTWNYEPIYINKYFADLTGSHFSDGIAFLEKGWNKYVGVSED